MNVNGGKKVDREVRLNNADIRRLIRALQHTHDKEIACDEAFELIDQYVELTLQGQNTQELLPLVYHHLEMCRNCHEEYEAIKAILTHLNEQ